MSRHLEADLIRIGRPVLAMDGPVEAVDVRHPSLVHWAGLSLR